MKLAAWNVRGFGAEEKKSMVKKIIKEECLDLIGLVETKHKEVLEWEMMKCWGHQWSYFLQVSAVKGSGGYYCHGIKRLLA